MTICIESELVYVARHCEMLPRSFPELKRMLTISKALSAGQAQTYHAREFSSERQNYWSRNRLAFSEWRGALAEEWSLRGSVRADHFARLSEGQHPESGAQLVRRQPARTYENEYRKEITSVEHRTGCCWWVTRGSTKPSKRAGRSHNSKKQG